VERYNGLRPGAQAIDVRTQQLVDLDEGMNGGPIVPGRERTAGGRR
jgi:hypothetical protein